MNYLTHLVVYTVLVLEFCYAAIFTHDWAVHIEGGEHVAKEVAERYGFHYNGQVSYTKTMTYCLFCAMKCWQMLVV